MNRAELVNALLIHKFAAAALKEELERLGRQELEAEGTASTWRLPSARVQVNTVQNSTAVSDERAFMAWLADHHPQAVTTRTVSVNPEWTQKLVAGLTPVDDATSEHGAPVCDPTTGEVVPGVLFRPGGGFYSVSVIPTDALKVRLYIASRLYAKGLEASLEAALKHVDDGEAQPVE